MPRRQFAGNRRPTTKRQGFEWAGAFSTNPTAVAASTKIILANYQSSDPVTWTRAFAHLMVTSDQVAAAESAIWGVGIIIVSEDAFGIGITAIPDPIGDPGSPWWLYGLGSMNMSPDPLAPGRVSFDFSTKTMRRMSFNERAVLVFSNLSASHGLSVQHGSRLLARSF